jgi:hypothetical protein
MNLQRFLGIKGITMACPCCMKPAKLRLNQINRKIGCPHCRGQYEADPDANPNDVISIAAACSITKNHYALAFRRGEFGKHRFFTTFKPSGLSVFWQPSKRFKTIPIEEVDFGAFACECGSRQLDWCGKCWTWICQSSGYPTPTGRMNNCPNCGWDDYKDPVTGVRVAEPQPMQSQGLGGRQVRIRPGVDYPHPSEPAKAALPPGTALTKWRGQ